MFVLLDKETTISAKFRHQMILDLFYSNMLVCVIKVYQLYQTLALTHPLIQKQ